MKQNSRNRISSKTVLVLFKQPTELFVSEFVEAGHLITGGRANLVGDLLAGHKHREDCLL